MKSFDRIFAFVVAGIVLVFAGVNLYFSHFEKHEKERPYRVEINRLALAIEKDGLESIDLLEYTYVEHIERYDESGDFFDGDSDYVVRKIGGELYRFDYTGGGNGNSPSVLTVNLILGIMAGFTIGVLLLVRHQILRPFEQFADLPYELAKGNLTAPVKESKNRFFGRFLWGINLLRENMEQQKQRELSLQRDKKTLLLSLSHDIKTPLSAIKLYAQALLRGLYTDREKELAIAEGINHKADEIEGLVAQIISASREDFLNLEVNNGEFYVSALINDIVRYYEEKLSFIKTSFTVEKYDDCLLKGDFDRSIEVLQNIMENAIKYGDGRSVGIRIYEEDGCELIAVKNSGDALPEAEMPHIFESFYRGSNAGRQKGSGLGLYICRQLMHKMNGDIFAQTEDGDMVVTVVFGKA